MKRIVCFELPLCFGYSFHFMNKVLSNVKSSEGKPRNGFQLFKFLRKEILLGCLGALIIGLGAAAVGEDVGC